MLLIKEYCILLKDKESTSDKKHETKRTGWYISPTTFLQSQEARADWTCTWLSMLMAASYLNDFPFPTEVVPSLWW